MLVEAWRDRGGTGSTISAKLADANGSGLSNQTMTLDVSLNSDYNHTISGCLLSDGQPVIDKPLQIYVNNALRANLTTGDPSGNFSLTLDLPAVNNTATTYNVQATFAGDSPCNASAYSTTPNGTQYAVCTTIQYGYKPSSNSSCLTVKPQATQVVTTTKTMEQMQQEAKDSGSLSVYSEWSWWYPWFRLHFQFTPNGHLTFDVGISPLPFGNTMQYAPALNITVTSLLHRVNVAIASAIALSEFIGQIAAQFGPEGFLAALVMSTETKVMSYATNFNSAEGLISIFFGTLIATAVGYVKTYLLTGINIFAEIVDIADKISNLWDIGFGTLYSMISVPMNMAFMFIVVLRAIQLGVNFVWQ